MIDWLGMYHCIYPSTNRKKFYHILLDNDRKTYVAKWGRIGNSPRIEDKTEAQARAKIRGMAKKDYVFVPGHETEIGQRNNTLEYLLSLDTGLE